MIVLLVPKMEAFEGGGSLTTGPLAFVKNALELDPTVRFLIATRSGTPKDWLLNYVEERHAKRIDLLETDVSSRAGGTRLSFYVGEAAHRAIGHAGPKQPMYDVILTQCTASAHQLKALSSWQFSRGVTVETPMVSWAYWTLTDDWLGTVFLNGGQSQVYAEIMGLLAGDAIVFESETVKKSNLRTLAKIFRPSVVKQIMQNAHVLSNGADVSAIDAVSTRKARQSPVLGWVGYLREDGGECVAAIESVLKTGRAKAALMICMWPQDWSESKAKELGGVYATTAEEIKSALSKGALVVTSTRLSASDYLSVLGEIDLFVANVKDGTYGIRFAEMASGGAAGVVCEELAEMFAPEGYPYVFSGKSEMAPMLAKACKDWPCIDMDNFVKHVRSEHDAKMTAKRMLDICRSLRQPAPGSFLTSIAKSVLGAMPKGSKLTHEECAALFTDATESKMSLTKNPMYPRQLIRRCIQDNGFVCQGDSVVNPTYLKEK